MKKLISSFAGLSMLLGAANAAPIVIDFETDDDGAAIGNGQVINDEFADFGVTITATGGIGVAVAFDSDLPSNGDNMPAGGDDPDLIGDLTNQGGSGTTTADGNLLIVQENGMGDPVANPDDAVGGVITVDFSEGVTFLGFDAIDFTDNGAGLTVSFFTDINEAASQMFTFDEMFLGVGVGNNEFFSFGIAELGNLTDIVRVVFAFTGSGALDNLQFEVAEIPVPGAFFLLMSGIAGLGWASRKRKAA
ncbi:MAG: hypothetical protein AAGD92_10310 [Pseudomonadota bacterium]